MPLRLKNSFYHRPAWAFVFGLASLFPGVAGCQTAEEVDPDKATALKSVLLPLRAPEVVANDDFADLMPLQEILKGKRVVALGEQTHADGTTFATKVRLVQFLHQKMGFEMLVFESGFFSGHKAWKSAPFQQDVPVWLASHVIPAWGASAECRPLFEYLAKQRSSKSPLQMLGMDCRLHGPANSVMTSDMQQLSNLESDYPLTEPQKNRLVEIAKTLLEGTARPSASIVQEQLEAIQAFSKHLKTLKQPILTEEERATWQQFVQHLPDNLEFVWLFVEGMQGKPEQALKAAKMRDQLMAAHLLWMTEYYPDRKFIVWAASTHISRELQKAHSVDPRMPDAVYQKSNIPSMGHYVHDRLQEQWYAIGFTAMEGEIGSALGGPTTKLTKPSPSSLESLMGLSGHEYALLDFAKAKKEIAWLNEPQIARPFGYVDIQAPWPEIMDAILFTKTMKPATRR